MTQYQATILLGSLILCLPLGIFIFITMPWLLKKFRHIKTDKSEGYKGSTISSKSALSRYRFTYQNSDNQSLAN